MKDQDVSTGTSLQRGFAIIRALAASSGDGAKLTHVAQATGLAQPTAHRILRALVGEGVVEQDERSKAYRLSVDFFALAARAGQRGNLRDICRPILLRLSAALGDTMFLLVRSGYDAMCLDRSEGPFPIRSFTGDVGGRVALGVGQGALVILAFLPEAEREEIIRFNLPRLLDLGLYDEVYLRTEIKRSLERGYAASHGVGLLPGMAGIAVPVLDRQGRAVAALSVATLAERLNADRLPTVVQILKKEAASVGAQLNPFDPVLRRPAQILGGLPIEAPK
ncbi:DNA-binding IclR family transcriptional regulator [Collimonas sp. PA-H2]|uniref:IclR family transcriptional regulator n=1 Tax=Collimonas sp. PA-H2 TaxID=1881062 RepID=UPI000BF45879|nr:IclR family transcriptional regulator [Collimonas sp. PA-H2]PFH07819.1 DNA-binding IclR family transcriptional regulator [Collimonas sp. PA-H2]